MKKLLAVMVVMVPTALLTSACVPATYLPRSPYSGHWAAHPPHAPAPAPANTPLPIGRWDNVMMLEVGTPLQVLTLDGIVTSGSYVAATGAMLRVRAGSTEREIEAAQVMRVDRLAGAGARSGVQAGTKGAALGAGVVGVLGLIVGRVPPPRLFLAGAIAGAAQGVQAAQWQRGSTMIYLAPVVTTVGPQATPGTPRSNPR